MSVLRDYATAVSRLTLPVAVPGSRATGRADDPRFDEVVGPDGALRPAWKAMASVALALTPEELQRVEGEITRFLADDGVTYVSPSGVAQPWHLDPVPLVIDAPTWARLEVGLAQRAELLNALLTDLYGPQSVLASGIVPAASVFGHSGFARPVARASAFDPQPLLLSGTDLGRDADGEWRVIADRVQAPSGLGFAMQNRRVISQVLPELFQEGDLHGMEPYFAALRAALLASAGDAVDDPRVVVLSPGTHSETAFDQAFLANALGFPLVQGSDLVVHDGWVWTKPARWPSATPTERIDVIVRRVDAEWCDPLELRADSRLGVAGLAEAIRRGRVRLVNGLGAGVLENPALLPFLPDVCEHLLGEQLRLPGVPTWWCGDDDGRAVVLDRLAAGDDTLRVRSIDESRAAVAGLDADQLAARILAEPHRYVGQDLLPLSQAPVWDGRGVDARPLVLRAFTLRYGAAYRPLVGGLATVRDDAEAAPITKDVWVLKADEADPDQGFAELEALPAGRTVPSFAPRALEDMFWAGRYAERAEDLLRLVLTTQAKLDQLGHAHVANETMRVMRSALKELAGSRHDDHDQEFRSLLLDETRRGSAAHSFARLRSALEGVRDQLSGDTWRVFSGVARAAKALHTSPRAHRTTESGGRMLTSVLSLQGVTASMMRDTGWHMIEIGRFLERPLQVCRLLAATTLDKRAYRVERDVLETLLTASESIVTYRRRYRGAVRVADALELLLLDRDNPRSIAFALDALRSHLSALPASTGSTRPERLLDDLETRLADVDVVELAAASDAHRTGLAVFLDDVVAQLEQMSDAIDQQHFASGPPPMPLSALSLVELMGVRE
ncbi:MAG: circularly permuted type 2 ATP-grasp protein [Aeromicrobium sp.]